MNACLRRLLATALVLTITSCRGPTPEDRDNRRAFDALLTAVTLKNPRLLDLSVERIAARHDAGQFSDEDYQSLNAIAERARAGDWAAAEQDGYAFRRRRPFVPFGQ
jgi:hypothetical protein